MAEPTLEELANAARSGSRRDMERFLEVLRPVVARWAVVLTGSLDEAEDVAQAVLVRIHGSIESYSPSGKFNAWAYRITRNVAANTARTEQRDQDRIHKITREGAAAWLSHRTDTLELLSAVDELERVMTALPPQQRAVLDLVELQGFSAVEVGEMLEISPETVRVHLHRAKSAMRGGALMQKDQRSHG
jgi:RNA polymerase sigma-70 factor (ECF subfamily)